MGIRFNNVTVLCDATCKACEHRCSAETVASLDNGQLRVLIPSGWTQDGDILLGPNCTEERALRLVHGADLPDPAEDPPALLETRRDRLETMKEVVRADLEDREAEFPELREFVRQIVLKDGDVPDFLGHIGNGVKTQAEVRVRGGYVEISMRPHGVEFDLTGKKASRWEPGREKLSLTMKHDNLVLVDPPPFMDPQVVEWVQNCLKTMAPEEVSATDEPVAQ